MPSSLECSTLHPRLQPRTSRSHQMGVVLGICRLLPNESVWGQPWRILASFSPEAFTHSKLARNKSKLFQTIRLHKSEFQLRNKLLPSEASRPSWQFPLYHKRMSFGPYFKRNEVIFVIQIPYISKVSHQRDIYDLGQAHVAAQGRRACDWYIRFYGRIYISPSCPGFPKDQTCSSCGIIEKPCLVYPQLLSLNKPFNDHLLCADTRYQNNKDEWDRTLLSVCTAHGLSAISPPRSVHALLFLFESL